MTYLLGLDVGTSSAKAVLIDASGTVVATAAADYEFVTPRPMWAECDPADWWQASVDAIGQILATAKVHSADIAGIGLTGQMHGLVLLDASGEVLRPCIMWNDQRTVSQCRMITERLGGERVLQLTGNPILPGFTAGKIAWVRDNEPHVYAKAAKVLLPKDYVRYRLCGAYFTDVSDASGTSLLDVARRKWSDQMLEASGVPGQWMPEVTESAVASANVNAQAAAATGLCEGTPIAGGAGDQAAQAVGCGVVREGILSATFGTSGVVFAHSDEYRVDPEGRLHAFCHAVPGKWHLMGVMLSAAGSLQWYRNTLGQEQVALARQTGGDAYDLLTAEASRVAAGGEGLLFLPYLSGERTPYPDPDARGVFFGLTLRHGKAHLTRAVLEGITYGMRDSLELMRALGVTSDRIIASGGGAASSFWRQMMADVFQTRITTTNVTQGAAYGAALLGGVAAGVHATVQEASHKCLLDTSQTEPGEDATVYDDYYRRYRALYPALKGEFAAIAELVQRHQG